MSDIIHDPTRGWLLLTEKWPAKPYENGHRCPACNPYWELYDKAVAHCLSTAIEIAKEDWDEVYGMAVDGALDCELELVKTKPHKRFRAKDHHPYSVYAEFEVKEQYRLGEGRSWGDLLPSDAVKFNSNTQYRKIARLVKAKEDNMENFKKFTLLKETPTTTSDGTTATESQDELSDINKAIELLKRRRETHTGMQPIITLLESFRFAYLNGNLRYFSPETQEDLMKEFVMTYSHISPEQAKKRFRIERI